MGSFPQCSSAVNVASFVSVKLSRNWYNRYNYEIWRKQMLCLLESQGLVGVIDGTNHPPQNSDIARRQADWLVKGWILGTLSDEIIKSIFISCNASALWFILEYKFSDSKPTVPPSVAEGYTYSYLGNTHARKEWHKHLKLYKAAMSGDWDEARQYLDENHGDFKVRMGFTLETVLHVAVAAGNSEGFVSKLLESISLDVAAVPLTETYSSLALTDGLGYNPLHIAALTGNYHAAELLVMIKPELLYRSSTNNRFPLHLAAEFGHRKILHLLISKTRDDLPVNPFAGDGGHLLLQLMVDADFFDMAVDLVSKYPRLGSMKPTVLKKIALKATTFSNHDQPNFWIRPIYWCILKMNIKPQPFDVENQTCCTILEPPYVLKLDPTLGIIIKYMVPSFHKFQEKKLMRDQALKLVKCLCESMESLDYKDALTIYKEGMLTAAESGNHDVVEEIVGTFPHAIHLRNSSNQNFLHLAVKNRCEKVFNLMHQTSNYRYHYTDKIDDSGNSILHLVARLAPPDKLNLVSGAALQMQREIQWFKEVSKFVSPFTKGRPNYIEETASMIFTKEHRELKIEGEKWMKDTANSCTIVAALIVTVVFAAAITVPGGNHSESGYPMFNKSSAFTIFAVSDAISLFTSSTSLLMFLSILTSRYAEDDFLYALPKRLCIGLLTLFLSILFMMIAFSSALYLVFGQKKAWVLLPVGALTCLPISSFVLLQFPLLKDVFSSTYGSGIFGKQSDRPFP